MGLREERERIYIDNLGRVAGNSKKQNAKYTSDMIKNATKDSKEYQKYKQVLGNNMMGSLAQFRQMKYNDSVRYGKLKHNYRIANAYEDNSGSMKPSKIIELDEKAFEIKTTQFTGKAKSKANIAVMEIDGDFKIANSQVNDMIDPGYINFKGDKSQIVLKSKSPQFTTTTVGSHTREMDSEAKLFEYAATIAQDGKKHTINLLSEKCMCESCLGVLEQFKERYPNVTVNAVSNKKERAEKNKNKPWEGRKR